jgi:hypothetical protein
LYRGVEEKLGGPLNFFKPEKKETLKKYREMKEGGGGALKRFTSLKKQ